jgi:Fe-S-cluster containining protein
MLNQHDQFDKFINKWLANYRASGKTIYCRENCSGCCHLAVHATYPEAVAALEGLTEHQSKKLAGYIERLKTALPELTDLKSYLKKHRQALGPCPFLDAQGSCSIYSLRPLSCRALLSTRPAAWCTVDFSELESWDKQAYESGLDHQVVAWPTHYIAAAQILARELEETLLATMQRDKGWSLSGNFAVMVWLENNKRLSRLKVATAQQVRDILTASELDNHLLLQLTGKRQGTTA